MISKIFLLTALAASTIAAPLEHHEATSFAHFNENHNSVHHIPSASQAYSHKPAPQVYQAAAPQVYQAHQPQVYQAHQPQVYQSHQTQAYQAHQPQVYQSHQTQAYQAPAPQVYHAAPAKLAVPVAKLAHYAAPVAKVVAPVAHYAAPVEHYAAPVTKAVAHYAAPVAKVVAPVAHYAHAPAHYEQEEKYAPAQYEYAYAVEDSHTGDIHSQQEHRNGDHVSGQYSLHEADGTVRIVKYFDEGHGFNAVVEKQGHPTEAPQQYKKLVVPLAKVAAPQYEHHY